ncbi:hypothetical protein ABZ820_30350 [Streptomyces diacarni]|uniref:Uncharacterized protein n=2 Tax=Streptomyces TaxID=1883 RepID=A0A367EZR5_9ACTN|nr:MULTISPECIES: hypothetical protein [Streptomyces]RCG23122.1 hypothetical protein DTL70_15735 [Streptomyces diacarni]UNT00150.1 hypothetical protein MMF93_29615 [Streptomyces tubbatahanensis]
MKFVLEVDMAHMHGKDEAVAELGRVLRYWGGNLRHYALEQGDAAEVYDSDYREVGSWRVTAA